MSAILSRPQYVKYEPIFHWWPTGVCCRADYSSYYIDPEMKWCFTQPGGYVNARQNSLWYYVTRPRLDVHARTYVRTHAYTHIVSHLCAHTHTYCTEENRPRRGRVRYYSEGADPFLIDGPWHSGWYPAAARRSWGRQFETDIRIMKQFAIHVMKQFVHMWY